MARSDHQIEAKRYPETTRLQASWRSKEYGTLPQSDYNASQPENPRSSQKGLLADDNSSQSDTQDSTDLRKDFKKSAPRRRKALIIFVTCGILGVIALALGLGLGLGLEHHDGPTLNTGPNVLLIMSDDQDHLLDSLSVQPNIRNLIGGQGVTYDKHYCTVAWCCPSRVNFFTGRAAHNTNLTSAQPPYGGWGRFQELGLNDNYLPVWLQASGVNTYYVGKFMNGFKNWNLDTPQYPHGWTDSAMLVEPWTYNYYNSHYTGKPNASEADIVGYKGMHTTEVTWNKALGFIDDAAERQGQFYIQVAPVAPHMQIGGGGPVPPLPSQYEGVFDNRSAPRTSNFNPDVPSGASWVHGLPKLNDETIGHLDKVYNHRLGNLAYIDDMVGSLIDRLEQRGLLNNTYIVYTTDNGFHIGNHRLRAGKRCPYEEDINIPLLIRGPDTAKGVTSGVFHSHTDMAPTILSMLNLTINDAYQFDGAPIAYTPTALGIENKTELVNVEHWNSQPGSGGVNTYKALRLLSDEYSFMYSRWCSGANEFYDMVTDPGQMSNRLASPPIGSAQKYYGRNETELFSRLDALLMVSKSCAMDSCREPWRELFPEGQVYNLTDAMRPEYDLFFAQQPKVSFARCVQMHVVSQEGPQDVNPFEE